MLANTSVCAATVKIAMWKDTLGRLRFLRENERISLKNLSDQSS